MSSNASDSTFAGSVPSVYERHLVPFMFDVYAVDLAARVARARPTAVLEIAAGTGAATRALARSLRASTRLVGTDLNPPMLELAKSLGTARPIEWQTADAMSLPFADGEFDAIACQFGAMFFPDKGKVFAEIRRVLRPGGRLWFNVWDGLDSNDGAGAVTDVLAEQFPADPPRMLARVPYAYHQRDRIAADLAAGGFTAPATFEVRTERGRAPSAESIAIGFCQGTPLRGEIEARAPGALNTVTERATTALTRKLGSGPLDTRLQALVIEVVR